MATNKAGSPKKKVAATPVAPSKNVTKTKVTTVRASDKSVAASPASGTRFGKKLPENIVSVVFVELLGTFALTLVAVLALSSFAPLYLGLALVALFMAVGAVSGAHLNPAVTFGIWAARRMPIATAAFYWLAQLIGAMAAVVALNWISNGSYAVQFGNFTSLNWAVLAAELVGTAAFLYGVMAAVNHASASTAHKALGVGLSLMLGLLISTSLLNAAQSGVDQSKISSVKDVPHELRVKATTLNPAIAIAATENTDTQLQGGSSQKGEKQVSRFSLEVILGSLIGAALGANLYLLSLYRTRVRR